MKVSHLNSPCRRVFNPRVRSAFIRCALVVLSIASPLAHRLGAQNLLSNPDFSDGKSQPENWSLAGHGRWEHASAPGEATLTVTGDGNDQSEWRSQTPALSPDGLYAMEFRGRRSPKASGGSAIAGPPFANRDFRLGSSWQTCRFVFSVPTDRRGDVIRLGQWHVDGGVVFANAALVPVQALHRTFQNNLVLGQAESIRGGVYRFAPDYGWLGANYHRPLFSHSALFNSDRWIFSPGANVIYRHQLQGMTQKSARLKIGINYVVSGELRVEASRDREHWLPVARFDDQRRSGEADLPSELFPAQSIFVRLSQTAPDGNLQVNRYEYEAALNAAPPDAEGETHFLEVWQTNPSLAVVLERVRAASAECRVDLRLTNRTDQRLQLTGSLSPADQDHGQPRPISLPPHAGTLARLATPLDSPGSHTFDLVVKNQAGQPWFKGKTSVDLGWLEDPRPGYPLRGLPGLNAWWCESAWKIGRDHEPPSTPANAALAPLEVSAARGESEAAQIILRPQHDVSLASVRATPFLNKEGEAGGIALRIQQVVYVHVTQPTDGSCQPGWYPDPLPGLQTPLALPAQRNQPLWLSFDIAADAPAGLFTAQLQLKTSAGLLSVPLSIRVYDFRLPKESHLRSGFGLSPDAINRYHHLSNAPQKKAVYERYLADFARHRISPYSFFAYSPIDVSFTGQGTNRHAEVDFSAFDQAAKRWLDQAHFNSFRLPLLGMGGGTFHSRRLGELEGFQEGTPEHARLFHDYLYQVQRHLSANGWLSHAYAYWFDEPDPKDYAFVVAGMERIKQAAPRLRRLLTEQPEPALLDHVEIWCGLTPEWNREKVQARHEAGQEVWWYICTGPKAPYVTEFIDHPATELRLWPWQSWQYGIDGILIWETTYWTSPLVFPPPKEQDPWADPMSYLSGYGYPVGHVSPWGNGDGRFLYPPRQAFEHPDQPCLEPPVDSMRWELLRDGMEDYEYLWLLRQALEKPAVSEDDRDLRQKAAAFLEVPANISEDLTHFTSDPRPILERRDQIARMLERLDRSQPAHPLPIDPVH